MFKIEIDIQGRGKFRWVGWTLDKPKGFLVHLPSKVDYLDGNLVKGVGDFHGLKIQVMLGIF